ncbi:MAG: BrnA antitoxin family protein [Pseudanabaena sp. CAN_BIN31]|nr:BrnA antitoxin family protein [Pseudanabaena sp. CAN_BIN31]
MKIVEYIADPIHKPQLSQAEESYLANLADEDIDYSDTEELDEQFWSKAEIVSPDLTTPVTLRVKQSILQFFQKNGKKGYQSRMNAVLESYVKFHHKD